MLQSHSGFRRSLPLPEPDSLVTIAALRAVGDCLVTQAVSPWCCGEAENDREVHSAVAGTYSPET